MESIINKGENCHNCKLCVQSNNGYICRRFGFNITANNGKEGCPIKKPQNDIDSEKLLKFFYDLYDRIIETEGYDKSKQAVLRLIADGIEVLNLMGMSKEAESEVDEMEFHVGDTVKIKDYKVGEIPDTLWVEEMYVMAGKEVKVREVHSDVDQLFVEFNGDCWYIYQDDVDSVISSACNIPDISIGDIVRLKSYNIDEFPSLWKESMYDMAGKEVSVIDIDNKNIELCVEYCEHYWWVYETDVAEVVKHGRKQFTKDDLETGMIVEVENGDKFFVLKEKDKYIDDEGYVIGYSYNDDLTDKDGNIRWDIQKVFQPEISGFETMFNNCKNSNLVWEREAVKEMTQEEIEKALGYKIKIVESK